MKKKPSTVKPGKKQPKPKRMSRVAKALST
jgi:hypothetical protein